MGMYTEIKFRGKLKDKFREAVIKGENEPDELWEGSVNGITLWTKNAGVWFRFNQIEEHIEFEDMGLAHRSDMFIGLLKLDKNNVLIIDNEIKNYYDETHKFEALLDIMFEEVYEYKTRYEENDEWEVHIRYAR